MFEKVVAMEAELGSEIKWYQLPNLIDLKMICVTRGEING
jgi:hypothetical protein